MINYEKIVKEHGDSVWRSIRRFVADKADAEDCFQDTFMDFLRYSRTRHVSNPRGLLLKIAFRRAIDNVRRRYETSTVEYDENIHSAGNDQVFNSSESELSDQLTKALAMLKPIEAEAFSLRYLDELSYKEIAETLKISSNHVGVILVRAKEKLNDILNAYTGG
ncbi:RNA polymerase sigma factor SigM [Limihaloglobus sulfuriphilus]|uniref:RNA polymerase sigma factor SigM n=1 Tax=Limihaloglobus sulfuriphilus TaxID=1851148 RepID=A0A1R7T5Z1_9BACT|nr:sigma-70 family RNA polymerase sigma factor [Limihaloglobus sulfuriphilus]AQQ72023.1 RNA polymerase sigma factor SigM [Limihaloglobus sulfuriphilus]